MGNGQGLLIIAGVCWLALAAYLIGALLRRVELSRAIGWIFHKIAIGLYVLGFGLAALVLIWSIGDDQIWAAVTLYTIFLCIPFVVCTLQFTRLGLKWRQDRRIARGNA